MFRIRSLFTTLLVLAVLPAAASAHGTTKTHKSDKTCKTVTTRAHGRTHWVKTCHWTIVKHASPATHTVATPAPATGKARKATTPAPITTAASPSTASAAQLAIETCTNAARTANGLPALKDDAALDRAAQGFAQEMDTRKFFDHVDPDGVTPWTRIKNALNGESPFLTMGENIANGFTSANATCTAWMNSAEHRANILDPSFTSIGTGSSNGQWVEDFGGR